VLVESLTVTILGSRRGSVSRPNFFTSASGQHQGHLLAINADPEVNPTSWRGVFTSSHPTTLASQMA
jgi:hypothetical protein